MGQAQPGLGQAELGQALLGEDLVHQAQVLLHQKGLPVGNGDARGLLAPMLQGEKPEVQKPRRIQGALAPKAQDPALLLGLIHPAPP